MYYIGIDLGTSSVKLLLLSDEKIENIVTREYPIYYPEKNWCEQNPDDWYEAVIDALEELTKNIDKKRIKAISFSGQMHGLVTLDEKDRVIRPAILWNDTRSQKESDYLNDVIGKKRLVDLTGNISFAGFTASKILWLKKNERENFEKISKIMLPKDYIIYKLTGVFATDVSDCSGMLLLDVKKREYSKEMLEIVGISRDVLPDIYESYEVVGKVKEEVLKRLGFGDVLVVAGAGDNAAAAIGNGIVKNGDCNISLGTSGTIFVACDKYVADYENAIHNFCHSNGKYHYMACMLSAASCNKWWVEDILKTKDYGKEFSLNYELGKNNVMFLPYLMGERSPLNDGEIRGMFYGLSMSTKREDMSIAILEGIAFCLKQNIEIIKSMGIDIRKSRICGGGVKNELWLEIIANVLDIELEILENKEGASFGAALLALRGVDESLYNKFITNLKVEKVIKPNKNIARKYLENYKKYIKLYPAIKQIYN